MIDVENLVYDYPSGRALHGVGFVVRPGAVLALVGPNGAGKSTLMRCIAALDAPVEGAVTVLGHDTRRNPREVHAALGYLPDTYGLYDALTVDQSLTYAARSRGVAPARAPEAVAEAAARVGLSDRMETLAGALSRGLRQRLAIAQSIVHRPRVLLLDEPAAGLDPEARLDLSRLIRSLGEDGITIIVSSHIPAELEDYCSEMLMLSDGRVVGDGVVRAGAPLWSQAASETAAGASTLGAPIRVEARFAHPRPNLAQELQAVGFTVERADAAVAVLVLPAGPTSEGDALARLVNAGLPVRSFIALRETLEDAYLVARAARPATSVPEAGA